jgi:carboxyl-terminal processing protease
LAEQPDIGYVRIISFGEQTVEELQSALAELEKKEVRGLVLDLRKNFGGILRAAVGTSDFFLSQGIIVSTRGRDKTQNLEVFQASGKGRYTGWPMVVLVDHWTASAAEIVAACLQDHRRATIVGERTWGKGTVQNVIPLESGRSALKLTVATYWRPSEVNIHRSPNAKEEDDWGVKPDAGLTVPLSQPEQSRAADARRQRDMLSTQAGSNPPPLFDPPLEKAVECLRGSAPSSAGR